MPDIPRVHIRSTILRGLAAFVGLLAASAARNPPPTQLFYVPFPEDQQLAAFDSINTIANNPITVFVTFAAATDGTVIYYDHWADGYEADITNRSSRRRWCWAIRMPRTATRRGTPPI